MAGKDPRAQPASALASPDSSTSWPRSHDAGKEPLAQLVRGSVIADRYVLLDQLGAGGSGVVYSAFDRKLDRKLALKFMRTDAYDHTAEGQSRLLREGQSLARLSHPNVVAVYDVGAFERHSYIAMELIEGRNLRQWLLDEKPGWERTLAVFLEAARGLLAAHKAGLVHRDFKPDNVLIARDGRVCVSDFGLSHMLNRAADPLAGPTPAPVDPVAPSLPSTIAGTPAYMAPEQYRGQPIDGRADQFSFCAALYEALYGVRPFAGHTAEELMQAICDGKVRPPPRGLLPPSFLHSSVLRGLRSAPQDRYASMAELYDVLSRGPRRRRLRFGAGLAAVLLLASAAAAWRARPSPCQGAAARLNGVWDQTQKQAVQQAFEKTGLSYAPAAWLRLRQQLDSYADRWIAAHTDACTAANVRHEISSALLDQRMGCLEQRLYDLQVTAGILAQADTAVVERADKLATRLRSVDDCSSRALLNVRIPPPPPESAAQVKGLRQRLTEIAVLEEVGRYAQGLSQAQAAMREVSALGYRPLLAEAGILLGALEDDVSDADLATETLRAALHEAEASQDDAAVLTIWLKLSRIVITSKWDYKLASDYLKHAEAFAERAGTDRQRAELYALRTKMLDQSGRYRESKQAVEQGLASTIRAYGPESPQAALFLSRLGTYRILTGEPEAGLRDHERALAIAERTLGPAHPSLVTIHDSYGIGLENTFHYEESLAEHQRALRIAEQIYPPVHAWRQRILLHVAYIELVAGHPAESEALAHRLLAIDGQAADHNLETVMAAYEVLAMAQHAQGHRGAAILMVQQGLDRLAKFPEQGYFRGVLLSHLAEFESEAGQLDAALGHAQQAIAIEERLIPTYSEFGQALTGIGRLYLARGEPRTAIPYLERAILIGQNLYNDVLLRAGPHFLLARALLDGGGDRARAYQLAGQSRDIWQRCGNPCRDDLAAITEWLKQHSREGT
jgi:tetratricopeptide (TPR) repeat protein/predicted Ser/Thr protein kinase